MRLADRLLGIGRWFTPLLLALLVLGHACELPVFADALASHDEESSPAPGGHHHTDDEALSCDGTLAVSPYGISQQIPVVSRVMPASTAQASAPRSPFLEVQHVKPSTGPPLFLLLSSLLI